MDEPARVEDCDRQNLAVFRRLYEKLATVAERPNLAVSTYFGHFGEAMGVLAGLPVEGVGLDFCAGPLNLRLVEQAGGLAGKVLLAGVVAGLPVRVPDQPVPDRRPAS